MKTKLILLILAVISLAACQNKASKYVQKKIDTREQNRVSQEKYSDETKGSKVWWDSRYDSRTVNRHLNSDQFGR